MFSTKKVDIEDIKKAFEIIVNTIFEAWSCYNVNFVKHCGKYESYINNKKVFKDVGIEDRTIYEV